MLANECVWRPEAEVRAGLLRIWQVMQDCVTARLRPRGHPARRAEGAPAGAGAVSQTLTGDPLLRPTRCR